MGMKFKPDLSAGRARVDLIEEKGFNYMRKPFNLKKLLDAVERTISAFQGLEK